ncbi:hypothetical protein KV205_30425 [Streptomyces sp. SKN60]|uniref:hypothetical protein n=1 Tax=Streptomyces sp. SKN60 TaxID=2855506 RepID=UPI0022452A8F|nr:hypothetical protein [Streptomyces sp. SKN60]MCX2184812.1 hypothetical protein [Streptomyces sp. SKN60]
MNDTPGWTSPGSAPSDGQDGSGIPRPASPGDANGSAPQWSKEQPPAGQWQSPTAPGADAPPQTPARAHSGGGWGAPPPYGHWGPPPAAKPGVLPLRPLTLGDILDGAATTMRRYWQTVLAISLSVAVVAQLADILSVRFLAPEPVAIDPDATPAEALSQSVASLKNALAESGPSYVVMIAAGLICSALLTVVMSRAVLGRPVTLGDAWRDARSRLLQLLGITVLVIAASVAIMFVGILPGLLLGGSAGDALAFVGGLCAFVAVVWLTIALSLASPALMLERQGVVKAMKRSMKLVQGSWWRIFGITLLTNVMVAVFTMLVAIPFVIAATAASGSGLDSFMEGSVPETGWTFLIIMGIGGVITSALTYPLTSGVTVLLYIDQRIRREALDLELARAAGLHGYGG